MENAAASARAQNPRRRAAFASPTAKEACMPDDRTREEARRAAVDAIAEDAAKEVGDGERPRLTPQNRADPAANGEDATDPRGVGEKQGQPGKAEGER